MGKTWTEQRKRALAVILLLALMFGVAGIWTAVHSRMPARAADTDTVTVKGVSVNWLGNGAQDLLFLELNGVAYPAANENCLDTWAAWYADSVYINGEPLGNDVVWATAALWDRRSSFCIHLQPGRLKKDGADLIEIREGSRIPKSGNQDYYYISETALFCAPLKEPAAEDIFDRVTSPVAVKGVSVEWDGNGGSQDFINIDLEGASFLTANEACNATWSYFQNALLINGVPAGANVNWAAARHNDRPGTFSGWIANGVLKQDGTDVVEIAAGCRIPKTAAADADYYYISKSAVFCAASAAPSGEETFSRVFEYEANVKYDASSELIESNAGGEKIGEFESLGVSLENLNAWGITGWAAFCGDNLAAGDFLRYEFVNPIDVSAFKSLELEIMHNAAACLYLYPLNATQLGFDSAVQSFRTTGGIEKITLSTEKLAVDGVFNGFLVQLMTDEGAQFFLDSLTLSQDTYVPDPVESLEGGFRYQADREYDADANIFKTNTDGTLGEYGVKGVYFTTGLNGVLGIVGSVAYTNANLNSGDTVGDFVRYELVNPVDVSEFKSVTVKVVYRANACFYVYPLNAAAYGYENAVQSFRTGGVANTVEIMLSTELLAEEGIFNGFLIQAVTEGSDQFFLDSLTVHADAYQPDPVEEISEGFEYEANVKYDASSELIKSNAGGEKLGEYESLGVTLQNLNMWGLTDWAAFCGNSLAAGNYLRYEFVNPIDVSAFKSLELEIMHNGVAGFYLYPLNAAELGFDSAVQSFRTAGGVEKLTISAEALAVDGQLSGFLVQLADGNGAQFFLDSLMLSTEAYQPEKEDFTPPEYGFAEVGITSVAYTRTYQAGVNQDMFVITFDRNIFTTVNEANYTIPDILLENIYINGTSLKDAGIVVYTLSCLYTNPRQLGIFVNNDMPYSMKNDGFDTVRLDAGFAVPGSAGDYTYYRIDARLELYTNVVLEDGKQAELSQRFDPPKSDDSCTPMLVKLAVNGSLATLTATFDKAVGESDTSAYNRILPFLRVCGSLLSEAENVAISSEGNVLTVTFPAALVKDEAKVEFVEGLTTFSGKTVQQTFGFARLVAGEELLFGERSELLAYWISAPVFAEGYVSFAIRFSVQSAGIANYDFSVTEKILVGEESLKALLARDSASGAALNGYTLTLRLPDSCLSDGTVVTVESGFALPTGATMSGDQRFTYDQAFEEFFVGSDAQAIEGAAKPTGISGIIRATDGVAAGTNQLFVQFTTPSSHKYLPFVQMSPENLYQTYGAVGVSMSELYAYELSLYGVRESVWDLLYLDGKSLREWALTDKDKTGEWKRFIDVYYVGTIFNDYYMQIVIGRASSAVMDWTTEHTITFKAGFVTPELGVIDRDQKYVWNTETQLWQLDTTGLETVIPGTKLEEEKEPETEGCGSCNTAGSVVMIAFLAAGALIGRRKM